MDKTLTLPPHSPDNDYWFLLLKEQLNQFDGLN